MWMREGDWCDNTTRCLHSLLVIVCNLLEMVMWPLLFLMEEESHDQDWASVKPVVNLPLVLFHTWSLNVPSVMFVTTVKVQAYYWASYERFLITTWNNPFCGSADLFKLQTSVTFFFSDIKELFAGCFHIWKEQEECTHMIFLAFEYKGKAGKPLLHRKRKSLLWGKAEEWAYCGTRLLQAVCSL